MTIEVDGVCIEDDGVCSEVDGVCIRSNFDTVTIELRAQQTLLETLILSPISLFHELETLQTHLLP